MTELPKPTILSLKKAVRYIVEVYGVSLNTARETLREGGVAGRIEAFGYCPPNAHPDAAEATRLANGRVKRQKLTHEDWAILNFKTGTSGRLSSIEVNRIDLITLFPTKSNSLDATPGSRNVRRHPTKSDYSQLIDFGANNHRTLGQAPSYTDYIKFWKVQGIAREFVRRALNHDKADWKDRPFPPHLMRRRGEKDAPNCKPADVK